MPLIFSEGNLTGMDNLAQTRMNIYGFDYQIGTNKPTVRYDGSPLQANDRWLNPITNRRWFWNGTYWLSETQYYRAASPASVGVISVGLFNVDTTANIFLIRFSATGLTGGTHSMLANFTFALQQRTLTADTTEGSTLTTNGVAANTRFNLNTTLNVHKDVAGLGIISYRVLTSQTGSPTAMTSATCFQLDYRLAAI